MFGQEIISSNREHVLVSDLSGNDDINSQYMKDNNIDVQNIDVKGISDDISLRNDQYKPVQKINSHLQTNQLHRLQSRENTIESETPAF